jgi:hypothetical protein
VQNGHLTRAALTLSSLSVVADTSDPQVIDQIQQIHPALPGTSLIPSLPSTAAPILIQPDCPLLLKVLRGSNNGAAAGPSGWRGNMISCLLRDKICLTGARYYQWEFD